MKKKIGAVLTAVTLSLGIGVAVAAPAQAYYVKVGPFTTRTACEQSLMAYELYGGKFIMKDCYRPGNTQPYYFEYWQR